MLLEKSGSTTWFIMLKYWLSWEFRSRFTLEDRKVLKTQLCYGESAEGYDSKALIEPTPFSFWYVSKLALWFLELSPN